MKVILDSSELNLLTYDEEDDSPGSYVDGLMVSHLGNGKWLVSVKLYGAWMDHVIVDGRVEQ